MSEQLNLFEMEEEKYKANRQIEEMQKSYKMWKRIPEIVPLKPEYLKMHNVFDVSPIHICREKPEDVTIWWNVGASQSDHEYWVLSQKKMTGEVIELCPYCHAFLLMGQGDRFVRKWKRGETFYQEKSVREYYKLDEVEEEQCTKG